MAPVPRCYLDQVIGDRLASGVAAGLRPPPGLLQVAETLGGAEWRPEPVDWRDVLGALLTEIPTAMREPEAVRAILGASDYWAYVDGVATSWFEDDQETAAILGGGRKRKRAIVAERVMTEVIAPRRDKWAKLFAATAQWLRETTDGSEPPWREFVILADAVAQGCDLGAIPLMRDIAERTLAALALKPAS